ncbi:tyrosine-type recombinase/integrase [Amycolatopsis carbonis]|uniref:tyrosine-type recombinase/integrase n=1 Tax=Amycolatopsis carbonis TaxID=715471 RepID=UPI00334164F6
MRARHGRQHQREDQRRQQRRGEVRPAEPAIHQPDHRGQAYVSGANASGARARLGAAWFEIGLLFTQSDGSPLRSADVAARFQELTRRAGLPPIRLHDLRHTAASLALEAGADMKVVQHMLRHFVDHGDHGHSHDVVPEVALAAAEATAKSSCGRQRESSGTTRARHRPLWTMGNRKIRFHATQIPRPEVIRTWGMRVRHQGLEPRTRWLRVRGLSCRTVSSDAGDCRFPGPPGGWCVGLCHRLPSCTRPLGLFSGSRVPDSVEVFVQVGPGARCGLRDRRVAVMSPTEGRGPVRSGVTLIVGVIVALTFIFRFRERVHVGASAGSAGLGRSTGGTCGRSVGAGRSC